MEYSPASKEQLKLVKMCELHNKVLNDLRRDEVLKERLTKLKESPDEYEREYYLRFWEKG